MKFCNRFYVLFISLATIICYSCNKTETTNTQQDLLMRHKWMHYQTRTVSINTITNTVIKDTTQQIEACYQNSLFVFLPDSVIKRTLQCFTPPSNNEGRWYLKADSTFSGSIMVRTSYGTGWVYTDFGLPYGKMKLLTDTDFQISAESSSGFYPGYPVKNYNTLYLRAIN